MAYKKQLMVLSIIIAALALAFVLSFVFDPERASSRSAAYVWLDSSQNAKISKISISGYEEQTTLERRDGKWFVAHNNREYPAKKLRVEDLLGLLSKKAPYPVRSSSASAHDRLGLADDAAQQTARRITVSGIGGQLLLDLLIGMTDNIGREVYLRRAGQSEVRSGEDKFAAYLSGPSSWYNLRLLADSEGGAIDIKNVQRLTIAHNGETAVFSRWNREWAISGITVSSPDISKIEAYISAVLDAEADNFDGTSNAAEDTFFADSRITLELGDGSVKTIRLGPAAEDGRRLAAVSGSDYVYSLAPWAAGRLFKTAADFEKQ